MVKRGQLSTNKLLSTVIIHVDYSSQKHIKHINVDCTHWESCTRGGFRPAKTLHRVDLPVPVDPITTTTPIRIDKQFSQNNAILRKYGIK